jgi:hypothetical protein
MAQSGQIQDLNRQVLFPLSAHGRVICHYVADFTYTIDGTNDDIVEDCKGIITDIFRIKSKLFEANFGCKIQIVKMRPDMVNNWLAIGGVKP